jgi:hypothetical protein
MPGMDKRVEVRCTAEELARWKQQAGPIPLSRWIRLQCERVVDRREPLKPQAPYSFSGGMEGKKLPPGSAPAKPELDVRPAFKPDFGKRLK